MSVDKFGRHEDSVRKVVRGPPGEGFFVTSDGNYDLKNKRLEKLADPASPQDAVSVRYLVLRSLVTSKAAGLNFDANAKLIRNLGTPKLPADAANVYYVNNHALTKTSEGYFDAGQKIIRNLKDPIQPYDAVNLKSLQDAVLAKTPDGNYNLNNKLLRNVSDPLLPNDVATKRYIENLVPVKSDDHWGFGGKRLSNIIDPLYDGEAVNLRTLQRETKSVVKYDKTNNTFKHDNQEIKIVTEDPNRPLIYLDPKSKTGLRISGSNRTFHMHYTPYLYADHLINIHGNRIMWDEKAQRMYVNYKDQANYWGDLTLLNDGEILQAKPPPIALARHGEVSKEGKQGSEFIQFEKGNWNALKRRIHNISAGTDGSDAATIDQVMQKGTNSWNAKRMKISNVQEGTDNNDVAVVSQLLKPNSVLQIKNSNWDAKNKVISNVAKGSEPNDVATKGYVDLVTPLRNKDGDYDMNGKSIRNVKHPSNTNDAATKKYVDDNSISKSKVMQIDNNSWNAKSLKISKVTKGTNVDDVAVVGQLLKPDDVLKRNSDNNWDGKTKKIINVAEGEDNNDVVVYSQFKQALKETVHLGQFETFPGWYHHLMELSNHGLDPRDLYKWDAKKKHIAYIKPGEKDGEAVTFDQALRIENNTLCWGNSQVLLYITDRDNIKRDVQIRLL